MYSENEVQVNRVLLSDLFTDIENLKYEMSMIRKKMIDIREEIIKEIIKDKFTTESIMRAISMYDLEIAYRKINLKKKIKSKK